MIFRRGVQIRTPSGEFAISASQPHWENKRNKTLNIYENIMYPNNIYF